MLGGLYFPFYLYIYGEHLVVSMLGPLESFSIPELWLTFIESYYGQQWIYKNGNDPG